MKQQALTTASPKGTFLTETFSSFSSVSVPKHPSIQVNEIISTVRQFLLTIPLNGIGIISLAGFPGAGKTSHTHLIVRAVEEALGLIDKDILFVLKKPNHEVAEIGGRICMNTGDSQGRMSTDNFFETIGPGRRDEMLQSHESFSKLFGNLEAFIEVLLSIVSGKPTNIKVYLGTDEERLQKRALGSIELRVPYIPNGGRKIIITEGVNANNWTTYLENNSSILGKNVSLHVLKILFNLSPETSLIRVLRRDHERKGYSFYDILKHRPKEYYFIMRQYIETALLDPSVILLDKKRDIPPFTEVEIQQILQSLKQLHQMYSQDNSLTHEHKEFISTLIHQAKQLMKGLKGVSEVELEVWRQEKILKLEEMELARIKAEYDKQRKNVHALRKRILQIGK